MCIHVGRLLESKMQGSVQNETIAHPSLLSVCVRIEASPFHANPSSASLKICDPQRQPMLACIKMG